MIVPVSLEQHDGIYRAEVLGLPEIRSESPSRTDAIAAIRSLIQGRSSAGELIFIDVEAEPKGLLALAGKYKDDESWDEIVADAYRERDEQKAREFPE